MASKVIDNPSFRNRTYVFKDRAHAGALLADELLRHVGRGDILLALPAGGVPVGYTVAKRLGIPLDVIIVRKIQIPWNTEAGFGAIAWDGSVVLNQSLVTELGLAPSQIEECISRTRQIVSERVQKFRGDRPLPNLRDRVILIVDDGLASGYTMAVAVDSIRKQEPQEVIVAVPTGSREAVQLISSKADRLVCLNIRVGPVFAVADAYEEWHDLSDEEVIQYLQPYIQNFTKQPLKPSESR